MLRAASLALLVVSLLGASVEAQRMGAHGPGPGFGAHSGRGGHRGPSRGMISSGFHGGERRGLSFSPYLFPDYYSPEHESYGPPEPAPAAQPAPRQVYEREPERPPVEAQVIELPGNASLKDAKPLPPTMFILTSGERLESQRFLLTANSLSVSINRHQRVIPLDALDLEATVAANRERGIHLQIPNDRNEISLSF